MKTVIYKENGIYKTTTEENYNRTIRNEREICSWENFSSEEEIIDYLIMYLGNKYNRDSFIMEAEVIMNHYDEGCKKWSKLFAEIKR